MSEPEFRITSGPGSPKLLRAMCFVSVGRPASQAADSDTCEILLSFAFADEDDLDEVLEPIGTCEWYSAMRLLAGLPNGKLLVQNRIAARIRRACRTFHARSGLMTKPSVFALVPLVALSLRDMELAKVGL